MNEEQELRELLRPLILEMYGLSAEAPIIERAPRRPRMEKPSATFANPGTSHRGSFSRDRKPELAKPKRFARSSSGQRRPVGVSPTGRIPGEGDFQFLERRRMVKQAQARGYAPPKTDRGTSKSLHWEMGH